MRKNAIIIGASSGMGKSLAMVLSQNGYRLGLSGRRLSLLEEIKESISSDVFIQEMDISNTTQAEKQFEHLVDIMGEIGLVIISAGTGHLNLDLDSNLELDTINTNVKGFVVIANAAFRHFLKRGNGHLVGISSIAALRGSAEAPSYNASKAFVSNYLEGLRLKALKQNLDISVTDIQPGFVDTQMAQGDSLFWVSSPEKAADQIFQAISSRKAHAYISKRWRLVAWLIKLMPDILYKKL
jgi:short-subunit dehydrogenase